ncbi:MAG: hypothetical protein WC661_12315 [Opitutaceae bacterium]|jgi:hypothetical protein
MALDRKSTISGALIAYLTSSAIETIVLSITKYAGFDFSTAINYIIAIIMLTAAWMILKERMAGYVTAFSVILIVIIGNFWVLAMNPIISSIGFWSNLAIYIAVLLLSYPYAFRKETEA